MIHEPHLNAVRPEKHEPLWRMRDTKVPAASPPTFIIEQSLAPLTSQVPQEPRPSSHRTSETGIDWRDLHRLKL